MSLVAGCAIGIFSCSDDNDYKATPLSTIEVLSASTSLIAGQDTGWVKTNCNVAAAYVDAENRSWIDVTVKGDSVKFFTKQNESTESRNTMLVIKKSDNDSVKVNITQRGMIFIVQKKVNIVQFTDDAKSYYYNINTDYVGKVVETPSWIEANFTDSRLNINVAENNEGHIREGYVKYSCGNFSDSICVTQYEFAKDILGEYELWVGYNEETDVMEKKVPATLSTNVSGAVTLSFEALYKNQKINVQMPVTFDQDSVSVKIQSGQKVASFKNKKNIWTHFFSTFTSPRGAFLPAVENDKDTLYYNTSGMISAKMTYDSKKGTYGKFGGMAYNEGGYSDVFGKMYIGAYSTSKPYKNALIDSEWWMTLYDMWLVKKNK